jgi:hypothetical protein
MTHWQRWVHRPQQLLLRKAFFQIHLWIGIAVMLYVAVISHRLPPGARDGPLASEIDLCRLWPAADDC